MRKYLVCENCKQVIGSFETTQVKLPLTGAMFQSKFPPKRQVPGPFQASAEWMYLNCTQCNKRAIFVSDRLFCSNHENGSQAEHIQIEASVTLCEPSPTQEEAVPLAVGQRQPDDDGYYCPDCGQRYQNEKRYLMYHKCKVRA